MLPPDPLQPLDDELWDFAAAAHLARRAGFGEPPERVVELVRAGPDAAVAAFVDFPEADVELDREIDARGGVLTDVERDDAPGELVVAMRAWWLYRMVRGRYPLQEKLTLCWHDHFACQVADAPRADLMLRQNRMLRQLGAGRFEKLLRAVARDPAMLEFLDARTNVAQNPNENWARELLELFTLGIDRYTQDDIEEIARAFTGWTTPGRNALEFRFDPDVHDTRDKTVFGQRLRGRGGQRGVEEGEEVLTRILADPRCMVFIAERIVSWFVCDLPDADTTAEHAAAVDALVAALAAELERNRGDVRATLRTLLRARVFYDPRWRFARTKSPAEFVVSALRCLGVQNPHMLRADGWMRRMGMELFHPPSVAGWDDGRAWVQTGYQVERANFALVVSTLAHAARPLVGGAAADFDRWVAPDASDAERVDELARRLLNRPLQREQRRALLDYLRAETFGQSPDPPARRRTRALVHLLMATPEFALC